MSRSDDTLRQQNSTLSVTVCHIKKEKKKIIPPGMSIFTNRCANFAKSILISRRLYASNIVKKTMEQHQIVPDVIAVAPTEVAKVSYPGGITVDQGNELKPRQVKDIPEVKWNADAGTFYALCMTDPDAPSRKEATYREWHHWFVFQSKFNLIAAIQQLNKDDFFVLFFRLVGNIPGSNVSDGETLSEYIGSGPPEGSLAPFLVHEWR